MNIELILVLIGLLMFGLFAWQRWVAGPEKEDTQHLNVFANLGCAFVIIGFGALIIETLSTVN
jgi:hypothetical protein